MKTIFEFDNIFKTGEIRYKEYIGYFFLDSGFYDFAVIQSFFGIFDIKRYFLTLYVHWRIFKNVTTL